MNPKAIIISRTDSIGDVILTLPMCGILKEKFPGVKIFFLARAYTQAIIEACEHIDVCMNWDELKEMSPAAQIALIQKTEADVFIHVFPRKEILWLAKRAGVPMRIATGRRLQTISKCNKLVFFSRKGSNLHESQLNLKLLKPLDLELNLSTTELIPYYGFNRMQEKDEQKVKSYLEKFSTAKKRIVLHPLSKGSAAEWSLQNYGALIDLIDPQRFDVFVTGTKEEGQKIRDQFPLIGPNVHDVTGQFSLSELIVFIRKSDALIAASTGPLHIAATSGILALGLYSPRKPIHPGRWAPVGAQAKFIVAEKHPTKGTKLAISPDEVWKVLSSSLV